MTDRRPIAAQKGGRVAYLFAGFFVRPAVPRPDVLPKGAVCRDVVSPFTGVGLRIPNLIDVMPDPDTVQVLAREMGLEASECWLYLNYSCWGGAIDFVYGLGARYGEPFGPIEESNFAATEAAYVGLMAQFGLSAKAALRFKPFERGYWGD
jgi:hypothetical protein